MNERGAAAALAAVARGTADKLEPLCAWLSEHDGIRGRYLAADLRGAVEKAAREPGLTDANAGALLDELLLELEDRGDSVLAAFFRADGPEHLFHLEGAVLGSARVLSAELGASLEDVLPPDSDMLGVVVKHPAQGRLGAVRTAAWLQTVLGAIGLAAYQRSETLAPLAACPSLASASYLAGGRGLPTDLEHAARFPGDGIADLAVLFEDSECLELMQDATARSPTDLAQARLTLAARWLQAASSAVSTADALVLLGIALETVTGDKSKASVLERISKRAATFLAGAAAEEERDDIYYDELIRVKRLYDLRSRAAHGQYNEWSADQVVGDTARDELHRFVLDVCLGFRRHVRERGMQDDEDFDRWWKRVEIKGVFA